MRAHMPSSTCARESTHAPMLPCSHTQMIADAHMNVCTQEELDSDSRHSLRLACGHAGVQPRPHRILSHLTIRPTVHPPLPSHSSAPSGPPTFTLP